VRVVGVAATTGRQRLHHVVGETIGRAGQLAPKREQELFEALARICHSRQRRAEGVELRHQPRLVERVKDGELGREVAVDVGGRDAGRGSDRRNRRLAVADVRELDECGLQDGLADTVFLGLRHRALPSILKNEWYSLLTSTSTPS